MFKRWLRDEGGATAIEYGLLAAIAAVACVGGISALGGGTEGMWTKVGTAIKTHLGTTPPP